MSTSALMASDMHEAPQEGGIFSFISGGRELIASGPMQRIETPAFGGDDLQGAFQKALAQAFERARQGGQSNPRIVGAVPFDPREASCLYIPAHSEWRDCVETEAGPLSNLPALVAQRDIPGEPAFKRSVEQAIVNFRHSDVRKAVLSTQRELVFADTVDVDAVARNLRTQNPGGYHFRVPMADGGTLLGVSPELLVRKEGASFVSNPLAGSAKRMAEAQADRRNAEWLTASEKDHHEHAFVTSDIAARVGEMCAQLNVPARPSLISTPALWHLSTRIEGRLIDPCVNALQLACRMHPTPAVCGYPTELARRLIRFVEQHERGLFTGMVGWCDAEGNGEWAVTIRCGTINGDRIRLFAGAGIVEASQPETEWAEVQTKLSTMLRACGLLH